MAADQLTQGTLFGDVPKRSHPRFVNRLDERCGSLTVVAYHSSGVGGAHWLCDCDCGQGQAILTGSQIRRKAIVRCAKCRQPTEKPSEKRCNKCERLLPFDAEHFRISNQHPFGLRAVCRVCDRPDANRIAQRRSRAIRSEVLTHYSGGTPKCLCCGEATYEFLALDHIEGGGAEDRRKHPNTQRFLLSIIREGFPDRFRVLCHNCNMCCKNYGYCIHNPDRIRFHMPVRPKAGNVLIPVGEDCPDATQICIKCDRRFPIQSAFFSKNLGMATGHLRMCKDCQRRIQYERDKPRKEAQKLQIFTHYSKGPPRCACCGENRIELLSIDHIDGGGIQHRQTMSHFYPWIIANGFPTTLQVLCYNCNFAKGHHGACPHARENY